MDTVLNVDQRLQLGWIARGDTKNFVAKKKKCYLKEDYEIFALITDKELDKVW